jgi:molybdate/tungstate transport system ATP-binding protein
MEKKDLELKLDGISKAWKGFELRDVSLDVGDGEYFVILGPTGAGKTLLLEVIMGFHKPDKGRILLGDRDITFVGPQKRGIGYVPQDLMLFPHMSVRQNIGFGLKMRGTEKSDLKRKVDRMLALMELEPLEKQLPVVLSGGEKQKVALARVLVTEPAVILLDEPLSSVDPEAFQGLVEELRRVHRELHSTVVHVTHDQMEAFSLAERVAIMRNGETVQVGSAREVFDHPRNEFVARFLGYENIFHGSTVEHGEKQLLVDVDGFLTKVDGDSKERNCVLAVRPEDVDVSLAASDSADLNVLRGEITDYTDLGPILTLKVDAGILIKATMTKRAFFEARLDRGQDVAVAFKSSSVKILE